MRQRWRARQERRRIERECRDHLRRVIAMLEATFAPASDPRG